MCKDISEEEYTMNKTELIAVVSEKAELSK